MRTNPIQPISFSGLKIEGTIPAKNIKKLNEITKIFEKNELITDLENNFNTDIVINSELDKASFSHKKYGSLSKYIKPSLIENLLAQASELKSNIKIAVRKAEKDYLKSQTIYESSRRGC